MTAPYGESSTTMPFCRYSCSRSRSRDRAHSRSRLRATGLRAAAALVLSALALIGSPSATNAQAVSTPFTANNVALNSLSSSITYTVDLATLPARARLIAEATPDAGHADMQLELQISNCTLVNPNTGTDPYFCPSPISTPNPGLQTVQYDTWVCEYDDTPPIYAGETCQVTVRPLSFGSAGAPATFDLVIRGETIVPSSTIDVELVSTNQIATIPAIKDTTLYQANPSSSNGQGQAFWTSTGTANANLHALLAFDIAANVPAGATIVDASLELNVLATGGATPSFRIFPVTRDPAVAWVEGSAVPSADDSVPPTPVNNAATWSHRQWHPANPQGPWATAGGDGVLPSLRNLTVTQTGLLVIESANLVEYVRSLHADPAAFDGMQIFPLSGAIRFASAEHATASLRPRLLVEYFVPVSTPSGADLPVGTGPYFNEGQNFRWLYDLDNDQEVAGVEAQGTCRWAAQGQGDQSFPYSYTFEGNSSYAGLDCCVWQIGSILGVTGTGQAIFYINVDASLPANQPADADADGIKDLCDNCPSQANGPLRGSCTTGTTIGASCRSNQECPGGGSCSLAQEDVDRDGIGNVCVPEPSSGAMLTAGLSAIAALAAQRGRSARRASAERRSRGAAIRASC